MASVEQLQEHSVGDDPASPRGRSHDPSGARPRSPPCQDHVAEPPSAHMPKKPRVSSLNKLLGTTTSKESSITATSSPYPQAVAHGTIEVSPPSRKRLSLGSPILVRDPPFWYFRFYIRTDLCGSFHTYPDLGGPFQSLQEADNAIDRHLLDLQDPKMCDDSLDKLSLMERAIRRSLYWPDGTMKKRSEPPAIDKSRDRMRLLVQALVDQYNEDHNLLGDLAYELKDVLHHQFFVSEGHSYFHINFTTETKGVDGFDCAIDNLFFAEVKFIQRHKAVVASCFCIVKPDDNGHCYGCKSTGKVGMKHPSKADAYSGGHVDGYVPGGGYHIPPSNPLLSEEDRLRIIFQVVAYLVRALIIGRNITLTQAKKHAGVED